MYIQLHNQDKLIYMRCIDFLKISFIRSYDSTVIVTKMFQSEFIFWHFTEFLKEYCREEY